jgi:hypothetical protein
VKEKLRAGDRLDAVLFSRVSTCQLRGVNSRVPRESSLIGGSVPCGTGDCRSSVAPDSDPGSSLDSRVRENDERRGARPTGVASGYAPAMTVRLQAVSPHVA